MILHEWQGPEMKIIKADPREYEELGFNGKEPALCPLANRRHGQFGSEEPAN